MSSVTPIPTALKKDSIYPNRSEKGSTNSRKLGSITLTPTAEKRAAITLVVVQTLPPTAVKWVA